MTKRKMAIIIIILALFSGGIYYFVAVHNPKSDNNVTEQKGAENVAAASKERAANNKDGSSNGEKPASDRELSGATLTIASFEQSGGLVKVSATINKGSTGTCYYNFSSPNTKPVIRTNQSQSQSGKQLCRVEIPEVEFVKLGTWKMLLTFTQDGASVEGSQDVTIN